MHHNDVDETRNESKFSRKVLHEPQHLEHPSYRGNNRTPKILIQASLLSKRL